MRVTILGAGSSGGVPLVGFEWGACDPDNPKNLRTRPSLLIEIEGRTFLIDTSPDLRQQLLTAGVRRLDAVLYTHAHADHLNGMDDLRGINRAMHAPLDFYCDATTLETIRQRFGYVLDPLRPGADRYYKPVLHPHVVQPGDLFEVAGVAMQVFDQDHGFSRTLGYRIGDFGYSTDLVEMSDAAFAALDGIHTWVLGCFTDQPHMTHVHLPKALEWIERLRPERTILTHLGPDLDYEALSAKLPDGVFAAYDGFDFEVPSRAA